MVPLAPGSSLLPHLVAVVMATVRQVSRRCGCFRRGRVGVYGFVDLKIARAGRTQPVGQIELESRRNVHVEGGSDWLLRVESAANPESNR